MFIALGTLGVVPVAPRSRSSRHHHMDRRHDRFNTSRGSCRQRERILSRMGPMQRDSEAGITLLEMVCVLAIIALLVAVALPWMEPSTSRAKLESYAVEIAALLKADRNAALAGGSAVAAVIDAQGRTVRSGSGARSVRVPDDVVFEALLPQRCNGRPGLSTISFFASGMSCGGMIRLTCPGGGLEIRINWLTGDIDLVAST